MEKLGLVPGQIVNPVIPTGGYSNPEYTQGLTDYVSEVSTNLNTATVQAEQKAKERQVQNILIGAVAAYVLYKYVL